MSTDDTSLATELLIADENMGVGTLFLLLTKSLREQISNLDSAVLGKGLCTPGAVSETGTVPPEFSFSV